MRTFEEQTARVVEALFDDLLNEDEADFRCLQTDSGGEACSSVQILLAEDAGEM